MDDGLAERMFQEIRAETMCDFLHDIKECKDLNQTSNSIASSTRSLGDIHEIHGPANSGRTHMVYQSLLQCLAPRNLAGRFNNSAVVYDMDMSFDAERLHVMMSTYIRDAQTHHMEDDAVYSTTIRRPEEVADTCLENLIVFRPMSLLQLATSLGNLPAYMATHLPNSILALVVVDPLSGPSHWLDRHIAKKTKNENGSRHAVPSPMRRAIWALDQLRAQYNVAVVYTCWTLGVSTQGSVYWQHVRSARVTHTSSTSVPPFFTQRSNVGDNPMRTQSALNIASISYDLPVDDSQPHAELCHTMLVPRPSELLNPGSDLGQLLLDRGGSCTSVDMISMRHKPPLSVPRTAAESSIQVTDAALRIVPSKN